ncbi:MAG: hypothetical protein ACLFQB_07830 [Chitinispirillaceae bacterium]
MHKRSMIKNVLISGIAAGAVMFGCNEFPTRYDRVESYEFRLLDFIYEPADAAPGDTVTLKAVFAGKTHDQLSSIDWKMSTKVMVNKYGTDTAFDFQPLEFETVDYSFSEKTQSVAFRFEIPDDVIRNSPAIPENWIDLVPNHLKNSLPEELSSLKRSELVDSVENYAQNPSSISPQFSLLLPAVLQFLTARIRIEANVPGEHRIISNYSVRYNSRFSDLPFISLNKNPTIDSVGIYKVKGENMVGYDPAKNKHEFLRLYGPHDSEEDTSALLVEKGHTYFLVAFTGNVDSSITMDAATGGPQWLKEDHFTMWYYHLDSAETEGVPQSKYLSVSNDGGLMVPFYPPLDKRITQFVVWLEVNDRMLNEMYRPQGSTLEEFHCQIEYAPGFFD